MASTLTTSSSAIAVPFPITLADLPDQVKVRCRLPVGSCVGREVFTVPAGQHLQPTGEDRELALLVLVLRQFSRNASSVIDYPTHRKEQPTDDRSNRLPNACFAVSVVVGF